MAVLARGWWLHLPSSSPSICLQPLWECFLRSLEGCKVPSVPVARLNCSLSLFTLTGLGQGPIPLGHIAQPWPAPPNLAQLPMLLHCPQGLGLTHFWSHFWALSGEQTSARAVHTPGRHFRLEAPSARSCQPDPAGTKMGLAGSGARPVLQQMDGGQGPKGWCWSSGPAH